MVKSTTSKTPAFTDNKGDEVGKMISMKSLKLPGKQPRNFFDDDKMEQLRESVRKYGILEPLIVRPLARNTFELVAGERRYRAAKAEKLTKVPVIVRSLDDQEAFELSLLENLQRDDLNPIEETEGVLELLCRTLDVNREELIGLLNRAANANRRGQPLTDNVIRQVEAIDRVFRTVGRLNRESFRTNRLPLLNLPKDVLDYLRGGRLEYTKAKVIAKLSSESDRKALMEEVVREGMSLREVKQRVGSLLAVSRDTSSEDLKVAFKTLSSTKSSAWADETKRSRLKSLLDELRDVLS